jgi:hypothetical protein
MRRSYERVKRQAASSRAGTGGATGSIASRGRRRSAQLGKAQVQRPNSSSTRPQVVAASLTAAFNVLSEQGGNTKNKAKSAADLAAAIDPVITFLRGGLDALKEPRTTRRR